LFLNQKGLEKNNKEIRRLLLLFNNKDRQEEHPTRLEDSKSHKELINMKHNTRLQKMLKLAQEDK